MLFLASEVRKIEISELFLMYNDVSLWNLLHVPIKYTQHDENELKVIKGKKEKYLYMVI